MRQRQVHRSPLHNELIRAPLLMKLPSQAGRRVSGLLSLPDLIATSAPFEEVGELSKTVDGQNRVVVEISPTSITDGEWDLLYAVEGQRVELYRARDDRGHRQDLSASHPEVVRDLHARYVSWLKSIDTPERFLAPRLRL